MNEAHRYQIEGSYYEACNCEAICPCRRQNGIAHGLSTYGNCDFILSWAILKGYFGDTDLSGLNVCIAGTYHDDDEGTPWSVFIYIDACSDEAQMSALSKLFRGDAGGNILFTDRISNVLGIRRAKIVLAHTPGRETVTIGEIGAALVEKDVQFDGTISCGIPGHDHPGRENVSSLRLSESPFEWDYKERCGFSTDFAYWS